MSYSHIKKKKLADRISATKNKEQLINIVNIILAENPAMADEFKKNNNQNGLFSFFHQFTDATYEAIEQELSVKKTKLKNKTTEELLKEFSEEQEHPVVPPKFQLSNREINMRNRLEYDQSVKADVVSDTMVTTFDPSVNRSEDEKVAK